MTRTFKNLPPLTPDEANVVAAILTSTEPFTLLADQLDMRLGQFLDTLAGPAPQAHLRFARRAAEDRARTRFAEAAHVAAQTLERITENPDNDTTERRRAATTISRFLTASRRTVTRLIREAAREEVADESTERLRADAPLANPQRPTPHPQHENVNGARASIDALPPEPPTLASPQPIAHRVGAPPSHTPLTAPPARRPATPPPPTPRTPPARSTAPSTSRSSRDPPSP